MYGLPKVHKSSVPCRPVCSAIRTPTESISKYLTDMLKPISSNRHGSDVKDTFDFVDRIKDKDLQQYHMVSFDVCSLFTNVPLKETIDICMDRLYRGNEENKPHIPEHVFRKLLEQCVCNNTFVFNGVVYVQIDGVAMGNSLGPVLANVWMSHLEETYFYECEFFPRDLYVRYVDDIFCLFRNYEDIDKFHQFINSIHPSTKFELEYESENKLTFLDTVVTRSTTPSPVIATHVKASDRGLIYDFSSFVPLKYKMNLISTLFYRCYKIASSWHIFHSDASRLTKRLVNNGFPRRLVNQCIDKVIARFHYNSRPPKDPKPTKAKIIV